MAIVKRNRLHHQISFDPFLLFVISSVAIHGLIALGLVFLWRSPFSELEEATPIEFVVVPPEESSAEPPPDTERQADKSSVAQGNVKPELPTKSDRVDSKKAVETPASSTAQPPPTPPPVNTPTPTQAEATPPQEPKAIAPPATPPNEIKPNPLEEKPLPIEPQPLAKPTKTANNPPLPDANRPLLSGSDTSISLPKETLLTAENPFKTDLPPKSEVAEPLPQEETPPTETENPPEPDLPPKPKVTESPKPETPPTETENPPEPDLSVATNSTPESTPIDTPTQTPVPETTLPSESQTAVGSSAASLLEGTQAKSSEDSDSTFFAPEANASQQASNSSGVDARQNQQNVDLGPYLAELKQRVRQNWQTPTVNDSRKTVIVFSIERNGQIRGLQIKQSSGSPEVDNKFLAAIEKSAPFAPLPANYPNSHLDIVYDLNINMYIE